MQCIKGALATGVTCLVILSALPATAQELGTIAGVVRDSSDAVLPGVTVEVSSPALIEKVRATTTDGTGQYRVINLPPGNYRVAFTLVGFRTTVRENIEVRVNFTTPINAEMTVGQQEETITVVAESPIVDVQTVTQSRAITAEQNKELPSGGGVFNLAVLVPGVIANFTDVGGSSSEAAGTRVSVRGGSNGDTVPLLDGLKVGNLFVGAGQVNIMPINPLLGEQIDVQTSGQGADAASLGVQTNVIPKSGGNIFNGTAYVNGGRGSWQADNLTQEVRDLGLTQVNRNRGMSDINGSFGGPLKRDRLWFYSIGRYNKYSNYIAGQYFTKDITATQRELDTSRPAYNETNNTEGAFRVAGALSQAQRLTGLIYYQKRLYPYQNVTSVIAPEAGTNYDFPGWFWSGSYTNVLTNRLLLDAAMLYSYSPFRWTPDAEIMRRSEGLTAQQIIAGVNGAVVPILEQGGTLGPPFNYRSSTILQYKGDTLLTRLPYRASLSYTTGSHNLKFGFDNSQGVRRNDTTYDPIGNIAYRTRDFVPNQITLYAPPATNTQQLDLDLGLFVQERWTLNRATMTAGLRADFLRASTAGFTNGPSPWIPGRGTRPSDSYEGRKNVPNWKDINPRFGVAYDLFGNGKTALKGSFVRGVLVEALGTAIANDPATTVAASTDRTWTDLDRDFIPDCDLTNPLAQGPATGAIDLCGVEPESRVRQLGPGDREQSGAAERLAQAAVDLGVLGRCAAGDHSADVGERHLLPARGRELHGDRQSGDDSRGLPFVFGGRASGCATSGLGGDDQRPGRRAAGTAGRHEQLHHVRLRLRRCLSALQRRGCVGRRPAAGGALPPGRDEHGQHDARRLRSAGQGSGGRVPARRGTGRWRGERRRPGRSTVLPAGDGLPGAVQIPRLVHVAVGCASERHLSEYAWPANSGQHHLHGRADSGAKPVTRRVLDRVDRPGHGERGYARNSLQ